jgi:hypothetical protein
MLRDAFDDMLRDFGYNVLVVHQDKILRCSCWSEKNQEASRDCPVCFGLGTVPVIEKHTTHGTVESIPQTLPRAMQALNTGPMVVGGRAYFFRWNNPIQLRDLVVEVDWDAMGNPIYNNGLISSVNFVDTKRYEQGQTAFVKAYVEDNPVRRNVRGVRIVKSQGIKNYELLGWGKE